jgi:hypothetical protein
MRRTAVLVSVLLLLTVNLTRAQTEPPTSSPPQSTPTVVATPTPEPVELPGWWEPARQLVARYGWWAAIPAALILVAVYLLWKVGEEVAGEEAKNVATRLRQRARVTWCRLTGRLTREEEAVVKHVRAICRLLELKGFVKEQLIIVSLESVYVPLTSQGARETAGRGMAEGMGLLRTTGEAGAVALTDLLARHPRLVLVGEGGSGKTTFLKYIALAAANACAGGGSDGVEWPRDDAPLPLFLPLHGLGVYLSERKAADRESPNPDLLRDYVVHHLRYLALAEGWVVERLEAGNVLILLDGLDEVARFEDRRFIAELVTRFAAFYDGCQTIVTTRPQGYEGAAQLGGDFERRRINPLEWPDDIQTFLYRWNEAIRRGASGGTLSATTGERRVRTPKT